MIFYALDHSASASEDLPPTGARSATRERTEGDETRTRAQAIGLATATASHPRAPGPTSRKKTTPWAAAALALSLSLTGSACNSLYSIVGTEAAHKPMSASKVAVPTPPGQAPLRLYGGDLSFRMAPPDRFDELKRTREESMALLQRSGLDFVVVTPRVPARFFMDLKEIDRVKHDWQELRQKLDTVPDPKPLLLTGLTYADPEQGTASVLFLDVPALLSEIPAATLKFDPGIFFRVATTLGGVVVIKHPLATPVQVPVDSPMRYARRDHSWRQFTKPNIKPTPDFAAADEMVFGLEAYNVPVAIWRDKLGFDDELRSVGEVLRRMDEEIFRRGRRLVPVGGSDSRDKLIRATTFIAASALNPAALREGLLRGRVCVRAPQPCGLRVYADDEGLPQGVGAALRAKRQLEFDWTGEGELFKDGESLGKFSGKTTLAADGQCHLFRLVMDGGYSAPIYVNCPFAEVLPM